MGGMGIGQGNFIPGLGLPDESLLKGPLLKDNSILKEAFGEKGLAELFNKDVLEDASKFVNLDLKHLYGSMTFTPVVLAVVKPESPILPVAGKNESDGVGVGLKSGTDIPESSLAGWFKGNMLVKLTVNMTHMNKMMLDSELMELAATLTAILIIMETAKNAADSIISSAEKQAQIYQYQALQGIMQAVGGAFQIGVAGASLMTTSRAVWNQDMMMLVKPGTEPPRPYALTSFTMSGGVEAVGAVFSGVGAAISGFASAHLVLERAQFDAYKEIQQALRAMFTQNMDSSMQARDDFESMIKKTLDQLAQITQASRQAAGINPHNNP